MKITKRSNRRLPSPLELSIYLCAVIVFCVINWILLKKAVNPEQRAQKSLESMLVESMLEDLPPVTLPADRMISNDVDNFAESSEHAIRLEPWMLSLEAFSLFDTESEIILEDWMISTDTWK
jgi:hypothetical protein